MTGQQCLSQVKARQSGEWRNGMLLTFTKSPHTKRLSRCNMAQGCSSTCWYIDSVKTNLDPNAAVLVPNKADLSQVIHSSQISTPGAQPEFWSQNQVGEAIARHGKHWRDLWSLQLGRTPSNCNLQCGMFSPPNHHCEHSQVLSVCSHLLQQHSTIKKIQKDNAPNKWCKHPAESQMQPFECVMSHAPVSSITSKCLPYLTWKNWGGCNTVRPFL